jgi:hypothetical protein
MARGMDILRMRFSIFFKINMINYCDCKSNLYKYVNEIKLLYLYSKCMSGGHKMLLFGACYVFLKVVGWRLIIVIPF